MLAALAVGGYLVVKAAQDTGPTSANEQQLEDSASQVAASINLQQATPAMEAWFNATGTYVGALKLQRSGTSSARIRISGPSSAVIQGTSVGGG